MDLRHMRHFVAVAEELHFGKAAARLNMTQPPVSQSIRRLEEDLGVELFSRSRRGVELTEAGKILLVEARRTLVQADLARKMVHRAAKGAAETNVSFIGAALYQLLPALVVRFQREHPGCSVWLTEDRSAEQVEGILAGDFDIGFILPGTPQSEDLEKIVVERAEYVAAIPADWPIARQDSVRLVDLADMPFIRPPEKYSKRLPNSMAMFEAAGFVPKVVQEAMLINTVVSLVGAGLGWSSCTSTAALARPRNIKFMRITDFPPPRRWELLMAWNPSRLSSTAAAFLQTAKDYFADNPQLLETPDIIG